jgi:hypothetical protein
VQFQRAFARPDHGCRFSDTSLNPIRVGRRSRERLHNKPFRLRGDVERAVSRVPDDQQLVPQAVQVELAADAVGCGGPVVPSLSGQDPGPHVTDGFVVTLWERVPDHPVTPARAVTTTAGRVTG